MRVIPIPMVSADPPITETSIIVPYRLPFNEFKTDFVSPCIVSNSSENSIVSRCPLSLPKQLYMDFQIGKPSQNGGSTYVALFDPGSTTSFVGPEGVNILFQLGYVVEESPKFKICVANGSTSTVDKKFCIPITVGDRSYDTTLYVLTSLPFTFLFGLDFIVKINMCTNLGDATWWFHDAPNHKFSFRQDVSISGTGKFITCGINSLDASERADLDKVVREGLLTLQDSPGLTTRISHKIDVKGAQPIKQRSYHYSPKVLEAMYQELDRMLEEGLVEPCQSPWSSPVVMVRKGSGYRFCIDFRKVNQITCKDSYPMPNMTSLLDGLRQARYLSKFDLKQAFLQVPLADESSKDISAFTVPGRGLFRFKVMPFGLTNSPATFQRLADAIFGPELYPYVVVFLDDILVCTPTFELHGEMLKEVFRRLRASGLRINPEKCEFGCNEVKYLGYLINSNGMSVDPDKVSSVTSIPPPTNVRQLRSFLGMAGWYRRFIKNFSSVVSPLTSLLKRKAKWIWSEDQETSFNALKSALTQAPILARPDFDKPFQLQTDASDTGLGAVLTQIQDGEERVIAFCSRALSPAERNYTVTEKECLAVLFGIERNRHYLEGYSFTVITDHASLKWLLNLKNPSGRLARWALRLQPFDYRVEYRKGNLNTVADALSRIAAITVASASPDPGSSTDPTSSSGPSIPSDEWYDQKFYRVQRFPENHPRWMILNGQLLYHRKNPLKGELEDPSEEWKVVLPLHLRNRIMSDNHDLPQSGHLGIEKTVARVSRLYYWPGLYRDVSQYVSRCELCQKVKPSNTAPRGLMYPRYNQQPWEIVSVDIMGPYPRSSKGNVYLLVFVDLFTRWVELSPIRKATSSVIISELKSRILYRYGAPQKLISDNAKNFVSSLVNVVANEFGITRETTPLYHSQANPTERANRNIKQLIVTSLGKNHQRWDEQLGEIQFALNSAVQESTKFSPAFLNFGRELRPLHQIPQGDIIEARGDDHVEWAVKMNKLPEIHHIAEENSLKASISQSRRYNLRRRKDRFHPGDLVLKMNFQLSSAPDKLASKLNHKYEGPYTVVSVTGGGSCRLRDQHGKLTGLWHPSKLKLFRPA